MTFFVATGSTGFREQCEQIGEQIDISRFGAGLVPGLMPDERITRIHMKLFAVSGACRNRVDAFFHSGQTALRSATNARLRLLAASACVAAACGAQAAIVTDGNTRTLRAPS